MMKVVTQNGTRSERSDLTMSMRWSSLHEFSHSPGRCVISGSDEAYHWCQSRGYWSNELAMPIKLASLGWGKNNNYYKGRPIFSGNIGACCLFFLLTCQALLCCPSMHHPTRHTACPFEPPDPAPIIRTEILKSKLSMHIQYMHMYMHMYYIILPTPLINH